MKSDPSNHSTFEIVGAFNALREYCVQNPVRVGLWGLLVVMNLVRLMGFGVSPPGFYIDESTAAANVLCIKQTGADYNRLSWPLFSAGPGGGFFTAPYLYGEYVWTSIFGDSVAAFRSFAAFITCLTVLFLGLYVRKKSNSRTAMWVVLMATVSPWVFQFSRIAWDPPLAPFFIVLGLYLLEGRSKWAWVYSTAAFSLAAYAYPPTRAQVPVLLLLLPGIGFRQTLKMIGLFLVMASPVLMKSFDLNFTQRTRLLALTSGHPQNPYRDENIFGLLWVAIKQTLAHFDFKYLVVSGDGNLRHSTQKFGIFSWVQFAAFWVGIAVLVVEAVRWVMRRSTLFFKQVSSGEATLWVLAIVGTALGIAPAALTWEGVPHSIRSIGAWPFLCIFAGLVIELILRFIETRAKPIYSKASQTAVWATSLIFFVLYLSVFFGDYPRYANLWFQPDSEPYSHAYVMMAEHGLTCEQVRR